MRLLTFVAALVFCAPPVDASFAPTHVLAVGDDYALVWSGISKTIDVYSLSADQYVRDLTLPGATLNTVLYDGSRKTFWGTGFTNEAKQRSFVWQWKPADKQPSFRIVCAAARLWDARQQNGRRYLTYESAGSARTILAEVASDLSLRTVAMLPDVEPREGECVISGPSAPYESSPYWIDFSSGKAIECSNDLSEACPTLAWFQVPLAKSKSLLCCWSTADCFAHDSTGSLARRSTVPEEANVAREVNALFRDPWRDNGIYAWVGSSAEAAALWKSTDDGVTWVRVELDGMYSNKVFFSENAILFEVATIHDEELDLLVLRDGKKVPLHLRRR